MRVSFFEIQKGFRLANNNEMPNLRLKIQHSTTVLHQKVEGLNFHLKLKDQTLPKSLLISYLHCLSIIQVILESSLEKSLDPRTHSVWNIENERKLKLLQADI